MSEAALPVTVSSAVAIISALAAALPAIAALIGVLLVNRNVRRAAASALAVDQQLTATSESSSSKLDQIHILVNSRLTAALASIKALEQRLEALTGEKPSGKAP
jgi:hypothetical protein